ncbi:MAG: DUF4856 domain-containing protein [Bacteroidota bacterium]
MIKKTLFIAAILATAVACKKEGCTDPAASNYNEEAKKDDGSCTYPEDDSYDVPANYTFTDGDGNSTVNYQGQIDRLNQLKEMVTLMKSGNSSVVSAQDLKDMFANVGDNGNGNFSFTSSKQLENKCFQADVGMFEEWMDSLAVSSQSNGNQASDGQAGTVTSGSGSVYLVNGNGVEYVQLIEKGLMGAVFMNQALNVYFGSGKMDVDNSSAEDPGNGKYYTEMEHHYDEAFGYFGVDTDFPATIPSNFWGKYCNKQDPTINSNADMMDNFIKGRAAIANNELSDRDAAIEAIRLEWEDISANQAISYLDGAISQFGNDDAKFLHELSEAYAFAMNLRYAPLETRRMSQTEHNNLMAQFKENFWEMTVSDLNDIKATIEAKY